MSWLTYAGKKGKVKKKKLFTMKKRILLLLTACAFLTAPYAQTFQKQSAAANHDTVLKRPIVLNSIQKEYWNIYKNELVRLYFQKDTTEQSLESVKTVVTELMATTKRYTGYANLYNDSVALLSESGIQENEVLKLIEEYGTRSDSLSALATLTWSLIETANNKKDILSDRLDTLKAIISLKEQELYDFLISEKQQKGIPAGVRLEVSLSYKKEFLGTYTFEIIRIKQSS